MEKVKYEFDPHSRLIAQSSLRGIRQVLDGQFKISEHNSLIYHIKEPIPDNIEAPHQVKLRGTWSLTDEHTLRLTFDQWTRETFGDSVTLQGEILDVQKNSLLFAVKTKTKDEMPSTYTLELSGNWQADEHNRLSFRVDKEQGASDSLTLTSSWQIDKNYQITYSYEQEDLERKTKQLHTLTFEGYWDIQDKARLSFVLDADSDSRFDFTTSLSLFKNNYIKYELGIGLSTQEQPESRSITFFGKWNLNKNLGLVFEVENGGQQVQTLVFGAQAKLTNKATVSFNLRNSINREIGAELELSQDILGGDGQAFLRLLKTKKEAAILAGVGWRW